MDPLSDQIMDRALERATEHFEEAVEEIVAMASANLQALVQATDRLANLGAWLVVLNTSRSHTWLLHPTASRNSSLELW